MVLLDGKQCLYESEDNRTRRGTMKKRPTVYKTTWSQFRYVLAGWFATGEGKSRAEMLRWLDENPRIVTLQWTNRIHHGIRAKEQIAPSVLRELAKRWGTSTALDVLIAVSPEKYDWSYAKPTIARIRATETAA